MTHDVASAPVLIAGHWRSADAIQVFRAYNPRTTEPLEPAYPVSSWSDCEAALSAAQEAARQLRSVSPAALAEFLTRFAEAIESQAEPLVALAHQETALAVRPRLAEVELPRTTSQLRQAAGAALEGSWALPTIDTRLGIRSYLAPIGPVAVFGPNNFPLAFNSVAGGDFAAAIAAGNPVIAKANTSHPGTTRRLAELALRACEAAGLPSATVQLIYRTNHEDGRRLVADPRLGATGYTGSRGAGLELKSAADAAGRPIYLELSSINPVVVLPGALEERGPALAEEFTGSCLLGTGQFCTNPGLVLVIDGAATQRWIDDVTERFRAAPVGTLLSQRVAQTLAHSLATLRQGGAELLTGGTSGGGAGYSHSNTLLRVSGDQFLGRGELFQHESFGNASLLVVATDGAQACQIVERLEGNLTGSIYSATDGADDPLYDLIAPALRKRVGRLLNDRMPTGVAVSPAMNHGGPYPATGHPGFTAVGIPAALRRFAALECFDQVRPQRLPAALRDTNPNGRMWRLIDGAWTQADVAAAG